MTFFIAAPGRPRVPDFEVTHETRLLESGGPLCAIIDTDPNCRQACSRLMETGYEYNLKGLILRSPDGHRMGCRYALRGSSEYLDYRVAPSNEWITRLLESKRIAIADASGEPVMTEDGLWTGDIEEVLRRFYSPG